MDANIINSSQLYDLGYMERKRYGQMNNASDIFNVKEIDDGKKKKEVENASTRRYQHYHYQSACPYGRDDITVDNPHKVHAIYQETPTPNPTEPSYDRATATEMDATEPTSYPSQPQPRSREGRRRHGMDGGPPSAASNGIERHEDIFVSREELQTPEQRKESLLKRQKLDQLLNNDDPRYQPLRQEPMTTTAPPDTELPHSAPSKKSYAAPYATSFDLPKKNNGSSAGLAGPKPLSATVSVSSLAPFATIDYNPYENYTNARRSMATADDLKAQAQEYQHFISHEPDFSHGHPQESYAPPPPSDHYPYEHDHGHEHEEPTGGMVTSQVTSQQQPPITPYFHETSSRHMPREMTKDEEVSGVEAAPSMTAPWKGKEVMKEEDDGNEAGLSKDHITSSFDKATALTDRDYFNRIMNDPHYHQHHQHPNAGESPEEALNREKYEQAKNRFDELYRDIMNTEDLKNHPELIEELNKISPSDLQAYTSSYPPPPPSELPADTKTAPMNSLGGDKEDYIHSLEDLDKKLEKFSMEADQNPQAPPALASTSTSTSTSTSVPMDPTTSTASASVPPQNTEEKVKAPMSSSLTSTMREDQCQSRSARLNRRNFNESHIFDGLDEEPKAKAPTPNTMTPDDPNMSATAKARIKASNSYNNIFGTPESNAEIEKQAQEKRRQYNRRHWKLAQQNHSDIFCLGGDTTTPEQKLMASEVGQTELPPEVPVTTIDRRASQLNLLASKDNPMCTTYNTMCHSVSSLDRQKMAEQPAFGLSSAQSHRTYKSKSRKISQANSSQILF